VWFELPPGQWWIAAQQFDGLARSCGLRNACRDLFADAMRHSPVLAAQRAVND